ncbi:hypothetical protein PENTCL1PPCAC_16285, partial [Pristionchus entomophagus]
RACAFIPILSHLVCYFVSFQLRSRFKMSRNGGFSVYVGNLPYQTSEQEVGDFCSQAGKVINVRIVIDRETGRPKGFGFVEYSDEASAQNAVNQLNGQDFNGRSIRVNLANNRN